MSRYAPSTIPDSPNINNHHCGVTVVDITSEDSWTREKSGDQITWMQTANLVKLLDNPQDPVLLLPLEVGHFAQGADL